MERRARARLRCYRAPSWIFLSLLMEQRAGEEEEEGDRTDPALPPSSLDRCGVQWGECCAGIKEPGHAERGEAGPSYLGPEAG